MSLKNRETLRRSRNARNPEPIQFTEEGGSNFAIHLTILSFSVQVVNEHDVS